MSRGSRAKVLPKNVLGVALTLLVAFVLFSPTACENLMVQPTGPADDTVMETAVDASSSTAQSTTTVTDTTTTTVTPETPEVTEDEGEPEVEEPATLPSLTLYRVTTTTAFEIYPDHIELDENDNYGMVAIRAGSRLTIGLHVPVSESAITEVEWDVVGPDLLHELDRWEVRGADPPSLIRSLKECWIEYFATGTGSVRVRAYLYGPDGTLRWVWYVDLQVMYL